MLTDNEIIKAFQNYKNMPITQNPVVMGSDALDLINRQKAEIENLTKTAETQQSLAMERHFEIERQKAEIDRLANTPPKDPNDFCGVLCDFAESLMANAKTEAIKEFAEKLKDLYSNDKRYDRPSAHTLIIKLFDNIDNLIKEMVGE